MSKFRAPKRAIIRIHSRVVDASILGSVETLELFAPPAPMTLVRMLVDIYFTAIDVAMATPVRGEAVISIRPGGTSVILPATSGSLGNVVNPLEIARKTFVAMQNDTNGIILSTHWEADIKAMRKLRTNDQLHLSYIADVASDIKMAGNIYMCSSHSCLHSQETI